MKSFTFRAPFAEWCRITKIDEDSWVIGGYASVDIIDEQSDKIPAEVLKDTWEHFIKNFDYAHVNVLHSNIPIGKPLLRYKDAQGRVWRSGVDDKGLFILVKIRDDIKKGQEVWDLIKEGRLRGFSIAGEVLASTPVSNGRQYNQIEKLELHEISVVDRPANKLSLFTIMKRGKYARENLLKHLPNIILTKGIVRLVGSTAELGESDNDYDVKAPTTEEWLGRAIQTRIHNELRRQGALDIWKAMEWNTEKGEYTYTDYLDLYDLVLLRSSQSQPVEMLLTEERTKGGVEFAPLDYAPISESNKIFMEWKRETKMSETKKENPDILARIAEMGQELEALKAQLEKAKPKKKPEAYEKEKKKPKAYPEAQKGDELIDTILDVAVEKELIDKDYKACMSKCLKGGTDFKKCVAQCKKETKKAKKPEVYEKPYPEKAKKPKEEEEEEKAKKPKEEKEKAKKPEAYEKPYPEKAKKPKEEEEKAKPEEEEYGKPKKYPPGMEKEDFEGMIENAISDALAKALGGQTTVKKSVSPKQVEKRSNLLTMPLEDLHKLSFSKIRKGEF